MEISTFVKNDRFYPLVKSEEKMRNPILEKKKKARSTLYKTKRYNKTTCRSCSVENFGSRNYDVYFFFFDNFVIKWRRPQNVSSQLLKILKVEHMTSNILCWSTFHKTSTSGKMFQPNFWKYWKSKIWRLIFFSLINFS